MHCKAILYLPDYDYNGSRYLCKHDTTKGSTIPWLIGDFKVLVAMVTG